MQAIEGSYVDEIWRQREAWERKPILQTIYKRYFNAVRSHLVPGGLTLEIGGGSGRLKESIGRPNFLCSDVVLTPWIDSQLDAGALPFQSSSITNVVAIDVLHHLPDPLQFFREALRILDEGGRIVLLEPHLSLWGIILYKFFHHEGCRLGDDPWKRTPASPGYSFANAAIPWLCLERYRRRFQENFLTLTLIHVEYMDFLGYPASGGFNYPKLLPNAAIVSILKMEEWLPQKVRKYLTGIRSLSILQKTKCR